MELLKAERGFTYDCESKGVKIFSVLFMLSAFVIITFLAGISAFEADDYFANTNLVLCLLAWIMFFSTGVVEKNVKLHNKPMKMNQRKWLYYLPFTHKDYVRSVYISWLRVFGFTCLFYIEYWLIILLSGEEPITTGFLGIVTIAVYLVGTATGIFVVASQFGFGKIFKVITMIGRFLGWFLYILSLVLGVGINEKIPQGLLDGFKIFCSPFSLIGIIIVPALVFGGMELLLSCDKKRSWTHN